ncbi:hypothetical protein [Acetobacter malorum]|uniref:hypothetical protein n=1 Tax=Acetobacter malorum TaxID=178901 RepID=UPI0012E7B3E4|nr:hypothetical protein [Acetobacter malorum]
MTWQLFSPDLPFLQEMTIKQVHHGFWDNVQPYLPLAAAIITGSLSTIGIVVTCNLANKARQIAEEQKKIAGTKLNIDIFDKRFDLFNSYSIYFGKFLTKNYENQGECWEDFSNINNDHEKTAFLFNGEDAEYFDAVYEVLSEYHEYRLGFLQASSVNEGKAKKFLNDFNEKYYELYVRFCKYVPDIMVSRPSVPTISPGSRPEPQPTAQEQAQ